MNETDFIKFIRETIPDRMIANKVINMALLYGDSRILDFIDDLERLKENNEIEIKKLLTRWWDKYENKPTS